MRAPACRRKPSVRSRTLLFSRSAALDSTVHMHARRGLGKVVSGVLHDASAVVHDVSDVGHDVGHVVGDIITGKPSKVQEDVAKTADAIVKTDADARKGATNAANGMVDKLRNAFKPPGTAGSGNGSQNHGNRTDGGTQTSPDPHPTTAPGSGGGAASQSSHPVSSEAPSSVTTASSSTLRSSASSTPIPSSSTLSNGPVNGVSNAVPTHKHRPSPADSNDMLATSGGSPGDGQTVNGVTLAPSSPASTTQSLTTTSGALPSNGISGGAAHMKGFPLAAAAAIGIVLGFVVVSALFWAVWFYMRKRHRAFHAVYLPPKRMLSVTTARTVSTVPLFITASEAGVKDENPFKHPRDVEEDDPFDAASLWRSSMTRSEFTLSV